MEVVAALYGKGKYNVYVLSYHVMCLGATSLLTQ